MFEKFWFVHCGYYETFGSMLIAGRGLERMRMPFGYGIGLHSERGPVLFDAPFDERGLANMGVLAWAFFAATGLRFEPEWSVANRLRQLGFDRRQVRDVLVTHMHGDHTGAMKQFDRAMFHVSREEWNHAIDPPRLDRFVGAYAVDDYADLAERFNRHEDVPGLEEKAGLDVFGDGSVEMYSLPGHTPGHCVFRVHLADGQVVLYAGDAAHTIERARGRAEPGIMPRQLADDMTRAERSLSVLRRHLEDHPDDELLLCHDPGLADRIIGDGPLEFGG